MLKNYLKIAIRTLSRNKLFTVINVLGLAIGTSAALAIFLIVQYDFSFDQQHKDKDRIFKVVSEYGREGEPSGYNTGIVRPMQDAIYKIKGVEIAAPYLVIRRAKVSKERNNKHYLANFEDNSGMVFANNNLFKIFEFKFLAGSKIKALVGENEVVLSEARAKNYFPNTPFTQIIGQTLFYDDTIPLSVAAVVADIEGNTAIRFKEMISLKTIEVVSALKRKYHWDNWDGTSSRVQLIIKKDVNTSKEEISKEIASTIIANKSVKLDAKESYKTPLKSLEELHFDNNYADSDFSRVANKKTLLALIIVAILLLLLGCINFINLSTGQANTRAKEIGVRKCVGAFKQQLIKQLLSETLILTTLATLLALVTTPIILQLFKDFIPEEVNYKMIFQIKIFLFLFLLTLLVSLFSGTYPAFVLSSFKPVRVLKGNINQEGISKQRFMRVLTVFQFAIAQFFIIATLIVSKQIYYSINKDLGFKKDAIINVVLPAAISDNKNGEILLQKVKAIADVNDACLAYTPPCYESGMFSRAKYAPKNSSEREIEAEYKVGDTAYFKLYNLKLLEGRAPYPSDTITEYVVNNSYVKAMGLKNTKDAIGEILTGGIYGITARIVGVMDDFHGQSTKELIQPLVYCYTKDQVDMLHLSLNKNNINNWSETLAQIEREYKTLYPDAAFKYEFFDDTIANLYKSEKDTATLLTWSSSIAVFISAMGLFALVLFMVNQRRKEIGVRKVLGASVNQIIRMLSRDLVLLVVIALVIASPIAWYIMNKWLQDFAYRIDIPIWIFVLTGLITVLLAFITTAYNSIKAAIANPVKSLRTE